MSRIPELINRCWENDDYICTNCVNDYIDATGMYKCFLLTLRSKLIEGKESEIPSYKADHCSYYNCDNCINNINNDCVLNEIYIKEFRC